ncbi:MAG: sel1 repeat family protein [Alphaproteobacteria bacterium]|nr:sel1 repeat family protein [Alphaproteobacteria bacterium]
MRWLAAPLLLLPLAAGAESAAGICEESAERGAVPACLMAHRADPEDIVIHRLLARALFSVRLDEDAIATYAAIAAKHPGDARPHFDHAAALTALGRHGQARPPIERALELAPADRGALEIAAIVLRALQDWPALVPVTARLAGLDDARAMFELAELLGEGKGAARDVRAALDWLARASARGHVAAMDRLAEIHANGELGQRRDAAKGRAWARRAQKARDGEE